MPRKKRSNKEHHQKIKDGYIKIKESLCDFIGQMWQYYDDEFSKEASIDLNKEMILNDDVMVRCLDVLKGYGFEYDDIFQIKGYIPDRSWKTYKKLDVKNDWKCVNVSVGEITEIVKLVINKENAEGQQQKSEEKKVTEPAKKKPTIKKKNNKNKDKNKQTKIKKEQERRVSNHRNDDFWQTQTAHFFMFIIIVVVSVVLLRLFKS